MRRVLNVQCVAFNVRCLLGLLALLGLCSSDSAPIAVTLYQRVESTVLSLSKCPTLSLLSYCVKIDIIDTIDAIDIIDTLINGAMPFSPLHWCLAMPFKPFSPLWAFASDGLSSLQGLLALLGFCPTLSTFLKLPKLSPYLVGTLRTNTYTQDRDSTSDNTAPSFFTNFFARKFGGVKILL